MLKSKENVLFIGKILSIQLLYTYSTVQLYGVESWNHTSHQAEESHTDVFDTMFGTESHCYIF